MKLGIKVSAKKSSIDDLNATNPAMAEVWFDVHRANEYTELFDALKRRGIDVGLHFWGATADGLWANIAYPQKELIALSMDMIKKTIDIAAQNSFVYVNIHPGCSAKVAIDLASGVARPASKPINLDSSIKLFIENATELHDYANTRNVVLTVETVPMRSTDFWNDQGRRKDSDHIINLHELPTEAIVACAAKGLWVANDFGHTSANIITDNSNKVWVYLKKITHKIAAQTRLIHLNFILEPFNGTDIHDMLDNPLLETNRSVPNKNQMIELLKLFKDRDDVWVLTEPREDHVRNYFLAKKIIEQAAEI